MGYFKDLEISVIEAYDSGYDIDEIAAIENVTVAEVNEIISKYENDEYDRDPDDMDGDAESALASAGFGTDEDYGSAEDML
jgi:transposase